MYTFVLSHMLLSGSKSKDENKTSSSLSSASGRATKSNMTVPPLSLKRDAPGSLSMSVSVSKKHKSALGRSEPDRRVSPSPHTPQYMELAKEGTLSIHPTGYVSKKDAHFTVSDNEYDLLNINFMQ